MKVDVNNELSVDVREIRTLSDNEAGQVGGGIIACTIIQPEISMGMTETTPATSWISIA